MKVLLEIKDEKAAFVLELLNNFKFVKAEQLSAHRAEVLEGLVDAVAELNEVKSGKQKSQSLSSFLDEL
jgi:hypothetical protein